MGCRAGWDPSVFLPALAGRLSPTRCQPAGRTGAELRPGIPSAVAWIFASLSPFLPPPPPPPTLSFYFPAPRARIKATDDSPFAPYRQLNALCRGAPRSQHGPVPAGLCGAPPGHARVPQPHRHGAQVAGSGGAGLSRERSSPFRHFATGHSASFINEALVSSLTTRGLFNDILYSPCPSPNFKHMVKRTGRFVSGKTE